MSTSNTRPFLFVWQEAVRESDLPATTMALLFVLATYARLDGSSCFPSQRELGRVLRWKERNVRRHLKRAVAAGLLRTHRRQAGQKNLSTLYELLLPLPAEGKDSVPVLQDRYSRGEKPGSTSSHTDSIADSVPVTQDRFSTGHFRSPVPVPQDRFGTGPTGPPNRDIKTKNRVYVTDTSFLPAFAELWRQFMGGRDLPSHALRDASLDELSTALAWTLHRRTSGSRLENVTGYFVAMVKATQHGQPQAFPFNHEDLYRILESGQSPDALKGH